jgi:phosphatidylglycerophosphate synthase
MGRARDEIVDQPSGDLGPVAPAPPRAPRDPAERAFRIPFAGAAEAQARRVQIGDVGEAEQRGGLRRMRAYDKRRADAGRRQLDEGGMNGEPCATRSAAVMTPPGARLAELFAERTDSRVARSLARAGARVVAPGALPAGELVLLARADAVLDERVAKALIGSGELLLVAREDGRDLPAAAVIASVRAAEAAAWLNGGAAPAGLAPRTAEELVPAYTAELRKLAPPMLRIATPERAEQIERALFDAAYKGVTDFVTKYAWPPLAFRVVRWCARAGITPNAVTIVSWALVVFAFVAFWRGAFGAGLAAAWAMTFLDTVDGKLARVTLNSSPFGHWLDHGLDIAHPPFWWAAWAHGLGLALGSPLALVVVGGYVVGRLVEGVFILAFDFETHSWRPLDSFFRLITARRNPNLVLLSAFTLAGSAALGFAAVAWWTACSIVFHCVRLLHALALRALGRELRPWEEELALARAAR